MRAFWERRARRLLPAAMVAVVLVVALQAAAGCGLGKLPGRPGGARVRGELAAGLLGRRLRGRLHHRGAGAALLVAGRRGAVLPALPAGVRGHAGGVPGALAAGGRGARGRAALSFVAAWLMASAHGNSGITYYATYTEGVATDGARTGKELGGCASLQAPEPGSARYRARARSTLLVMAQLLGDLVRDAERRTSDHVHGRSAGGRATCSMPSSGHALV